MMKKRGKVLGKISSKQLTHLRDYLRIIRHLTKRKVIPKSHILSEEEGEMSMTFIGVEINNVKT